MPIDIDQYQATLQFAQQLDRSDPLREFREQFHFPSAIEGNPPVYLVGNSLGLQPKRTADYVSEELDKWKTLGVRGHFQGDRPWVPYHEFLTNNMADLVGGLAHEVVMMNSLTVNLHLMLATFYRPHNDRHKILIESPAFPSDFHAVQSQIRWHGRHPDDSLVNVASMNDHTTIDFETIEETVQRHASSLSIILLPGVHYYTGQVFPMQRIASLAHKHGIIVGFDLAHAAGNVEVALHDWDADFAVWCSYKYLNSGPGSVGGCFVHERHARNPELARLAGWWGHDKQTRFEMKNEFRAIPTVEGWQISNPPILSLAAIRASLDVFQEAGGMKPLREKSIRLTQYFHWLLNDQLANRVNIITPEPVDERGCQLSLEIKLGRSSGQSIYKQLCQAGVETDWREPNVIRVAPVPLYNSFEDVYRFVMILKELLQDA